MKLKKKEKPDVFDTTISYSENVPNSIPEIEVTLGDMLMANEIIIDGAAYIWVDGYKGVNEKMQGYGEYQYKLDEPFLYEGVPEICSGGLHFCMFLKDVFGYYKFDFSNRYFKVKALVNKEEYLSYGRTKLTKHYVSYGAPTFMRAEVLAWNYTRSHQSDDVGTYYIESSIIDKLSAKVLILTEEITKEDYFDYPDFVDIFSKYWIESKEELLTIYDTAKTELPEFLNKKFIAKALKYYTPEFSRLFIKKYANWDITFERAEGLSHFIDVMETCYKNGLSKDVTTMILLEEKL